MVAQLSSIIDLYCGCMQLRALATSLRVEKIRFTDLVWAVADQVGGCRELQVAPHHCQSFKLSELFFIQLSNTTPDYYTNYMNKTTHITPKQSIYWNVSQNCWHAPRPHSNFTAIPTAMCLEYFCESSPSFKIGNIAQKVIINTNTQESLSMCVEA